jgi:catechol 2,3-dioxygenase-like lactoylglutathione lyase family enzyme
MTERKDFKRVVRARTRRTGESYSSALRNLRNARRAGSAAASSASHVRGESPAAVTRTIPDVRTANVDKTVRFYTEFLGFGLRRESNRVTGFVSKTDPDVEVTLNHGAFALPEGFIVEVASGAEVSDAFERAHDAELRIVDDIAPDGLQFSMLDPNGCCVTVASADLRPRLSVEPGSTEIITGSLAGVTTNDLAATRDFYVDLFGFEVGWERDGMAQLRSPVSRKAELILASSSADTGGPGKGFDLGVGTIERLEGLYRAAAGNWIAMGEPASFESVGIRCFIVLDPSSTPVNLYAPLAAQPGAT